MLPSPGTKTSGGLLIGDLLLTQRGFLDIEGPLQIALLPIASEALFERGTVVKTARVPGVLLAVLWTVTCGSALGQRERFPSTLPSTLPSDYAPPAPGAVGPAPMATFEGTIQPPPADWDPYGTPGTAPPTMLPEDPYFQYGAPGGYGGTFTTMRRLLDEVRFDYVWMPGTAANELGINDVELSATFTIPFTAKPILVTPGFAARWWNGPAAADVDLPSRVFDAYLDAAWNPQVTPWLGGELAFRVGEGGCDVPRPAPREDPAGRWDHLDAQPRRPLRDPLPRPEGRQAAESVGQYGVVDVRPR
ncbi:MAG: hypothetical protein ACYSWU_27850 [Planctomycetota bacterium]|jgi:hypothetical protein